MAAPVITTAERADRVPADLVDAARNTLGDTLESIVLYGSAAEGRLRPASDVNVVVVLNRFDPTRVEAFGDPVRVAQAAIRLAPMVMLRDEIPHAAAAFAESSICCASQPDSRAAAADACGPTASASIRWRSGAARS